jgi:predicted phosphodiesterase
VRIHVLSDLHLEFREFAVPDVDADVRVLAGDIHVRNRGMPFASNSAKDMPTIYVAGNHEFYGAAIPKLYDKLQTEAAGLGVHFLQNAQVVIESVRFLGCTLWTDFELLGNNSCDVARLEVGFCPRWVAPIILRK